MLKLTCVAPLARAARTSAAIASGAVALSMMAAVPNGPISTEVAIRAIASVGSVTCGPGVPSVNGSIVNSTETTPRW